LYELAGWQGRSGIRKFENVQRRVRLALRAGEPMGIYDANEATGGKKQHSEKLFSARMNMGRGRSRSDFLLLSDDVQSLGSETQRRGLYFYHDIRGSLGTDVGAIIYHIRLSTS
jgi:hypothetical protein